MLLLAVGLVIVGLIKSGWVVVIGVAVTFFTSIAATAFGAVDNGSTECGYTYVVGLLPT